MDSTYLITFTDSEIINPSNTKYIDLSTMKIKRINKNSGKVIVGSLIFDRDMDETLRVSVELYKKQGGEYRILPFKANVTCCSVVSAENEFYAQFGKCHGMPMKCPIPAGNYTCVKGNTMENPHYPPVLHSGDYMFDVSGFSIDFS